LETAAAALPTEALRFSVGAELGGTTTALGNGGKGIDDTRASHF
jgi:hypothetical protein